MKSCYDSTEEREKILEENFLVFRTYEDFSLYLESCVALWCKKCNRRTIHIYRGFEHHNRRLCCLRCEYNS